MNANSLRGWYRPAFWLLTVIITLGGIELGARVLERVENAFARRRNPFVVSVNPAPAFEVKDIGGAKCVVRSGNHPLMNPNLQPFRLERPQGAMRIFLLGGSAAAGWPYHTGETNISTLLRRKLEMLYPNKSIEVINAAAGTYASHRVKLLLEEVVRYNPDVIFMYNGNNEFLEGLVYSPVTPPKPWDRSAALRLAYRLVAKRPQIDEKNYDISAQEPNTLSFAFAQSSLYREDPRQFGLLQEHYRFNIDEMITAASKARIPLFLLTSPVNLKDWVPNVSRHRKGLTSEEKAQWAQLYAEGETALERKDFGTAISRYRAAIAIDDEYAEGHFRLAQALLRNGQREEAKKHFVLALERDAFPFRELPEFQNILKDVAAKRNVPLVDIVAPIEASTVDGIPGLDALVDYVHLTEKSQEIAAQEMLSAMYRQGLLPGISAADIEKVRIGIPKTFVPDRDVAAADLNYNMAMVMHQYERLDELYNEAITTFERAAKEVPAMAEDCRNRAALFREIHPVVIAYRDLIRAKKMGQLEKSYSPEEVERIYSMYREMIRMVKTPGLAREEFLKKVPKSPFPNEE